MRVGLGVRYQVDCASRRTKFREPFREYVIILSLYAVDLSTLHPFNPLKLLAQLWPSVVH